MKQTIQLKNSGLLVGRLDFEHPLDLDEIREAGKTLVPVIGPVPDWFEIWEGDKPIEKWSLVKGDWKEVPADPLPLPTRSLRQPSSMASIRSRSQMSWQMQSKKKA